MMLTRLKVLLGVLGLVAPCAIMYPSSVVLVRAEGVAGEGGGDGDSGTTDSFSASSADSDVQEGPTFAIRMSEFLDQLDTHRRAIGIEYLSFLKNATRKSREAISSSSDSGMSRFDWSSWTRVTPEESHSYSSKKKAWGIDTGYAFWYVRNLFSTTVIELSCTHSGAHEGGGDPDFDHLDHCDSSSLQQLQIDVKTQKNAVCRHWNHVDMTPWASMVASWRQRLLKKSSRVPKSESQKEKESSFFQFYPSKLITGFLANYLPRRAVDLVGNFFGLCEECQENCGGPIPRHPDDVSGSFFDTISGSRSSRDAEGIKARGEAADSRIHIGSYDCHQDGNEHIACRLDLSPYNDPHIRIVDLNAGNDSGHKSKFHVSIYRQLDPWRVQALIFGATTYMYAGYMAGERMFHYFLGYAAGSSFAVAALVHKLIRKTEQAALPHWIRYTGNVALVASPHLAFALAGPMWRTIARPAVAYIVGVYTCTSVECLSLNVSENSTALMSWAIKIFITASGIFGVFMVSRWGIFATEYVKVPDEYGRTENGVPVTYLEEHYPVSQVCLRQVINALGLAMLFNASSNTLVSIVLIVVIVFRRNLYHTWWTWYMWCSAGKSHRATRALTQEEYEEQGVNETARALRQLRRSLHTKEGRRAMSRVRADNYSRVERFRDGGEHFDLPDGNEDDETGWWSKCAVQ